jgi:glycosyltransferase involved in cell wall biosynthesis
LSNTSTASKKAVLMIAYTHYETDPRVIREAEAALSAGFEVDFLTLRREKDAAEEVIRGVRVMRLNQRRYRGRGHLQYLLAYLQFFIRCIFKSLVLLLQGRRYQVAHVNNMPDFLVFSTVLLKLFGAKIILDIHDPMPNTFSSKFKSGDKGFFFRALLAQERLSAAYADCILTVSDPVKDSILVPHGIPPERIHVIANFADDQLFGLRDFAAINGKVHMIFHGTILERYGLRDLIQALAKVRRKDRLAVRIIGEGDFSPELKHLIRSHDLEKAVTFENRLYPLHNIPDIVASSNLGLVPLEISSITNYALPLKLLEYISLGLPVVTVRSAAIGYYLKEGDCFFYKPGNVESLVEILDQITGNPECLYGFREKTVKLREKFLWSGERTKYVDLLQRLSN